MQITTGTRVAQKGRTGTVRAIVPNWNNTLMLATVEWDGAKRASTVMVRNLVAVEA